MRDIDVISAKSDRNDRTKWLPYKVHALDTESIMGLLYDRWLPESVRRYILVNLNVSCYIEKSVDTARNFCCLIALLHDIGKITPAFQSRITLSIENHTEMLLNNGLKVSDIPKPSESPHNIAGQVILEELGFPKEISVIVGSHHGRASYDYENQLASHSSNYFGRRSEQEQKWRALWTEWVNYSLQKNGWHSVSELPKPNVKIQMIITGLLIMSDWVASNPNYFPYIDVNGRISDGECNDRAEYAWNRLNLPDRWEAQPVYNLTEFFKKRFRYSPNNVQLAFMEAVSENFQEGIYILEAPMGIGKTESALSAGEILASKFGSGGIYFGLPTQATANGIFGRIRDWAKGCDTENHTIRLAHGMTGLNGEYREMFRGKAEDSGDDGVIVHEWFEGKKKALLADFVIATVDQFLLASLKQRHVMLRHLGLSGKVVIIDECHAYDAYMNVYLDRTLTWMGEYKVPVIILSATLPPQRRTELIKAYLNQKNDIMISDENSLAYPVITWTSGNDVIQRAVDSGIPDRHITVTETDESALIPLLSEKLSDGGCCAVIVNTVGYAQQISGKISAEMPDFNVICFHSRFTASDRADIEKRLLALTGKNSSTDERNKLIVVGTQVIEQSLDLDFDFMITEICPVDLLLQRSGRLHRHEKRMRPCRLEKAELVILRPTESKSGIIYSEWILKRTEKYLPKELVIPKCIPYLVSKVYGSPENDEELKSSEWEKFEQVLSDKKNKANSYCIKSNMLKSRRRNSIADFLDDDAGNNSSAEASVRDAEETIEVILMRKKTNNIYCLPSADSVAFDTTLSLGDTEARLIATQCLRLPSHFSQKHNFNNTVKALDVMPKNWRDSEWLKGELLLVIDENSEAEIAGKKLRYSKERGLEMLKEQG